MNFSVAVCAYYDALTYLTHNSFEGPTSTGCLRNIHFFIIADVVKLKTRNVFFAAIALKRSLIIIQLSSNFSTALTLQKNFSCLLFRSSSCMELSVVLSLLFLIHTFNFKLHTDNPSCFLVGNSSASLD